MKYFTKEWYELMQKCSFHLLLEEDSQAETYSEEYFQQLYKIKLKEWLDLQREIASIGNGPFDKENVTKQFYERCENNQEYLKRNLPEKIVENIADIRTFALDKASHNVISLVTQYCEENEQSVKRTSKEYSSYYKQALKTIDKNIVDHLRFHDRVIVNTNQVGDSLTLYLNKGGYTDINEVVFENHKIVKQDGPLENSWWLYDEIYKVNDKYEIRVLLQSINSGLIEFIILTESMAFKRNI